MTDAPRGAPSTAAGTSERLTSLVRRLGRPTIALPGAVLVVFSIAAIEALTRTWHPYGDWAVAELVIRHIDRHLPLSGPYSAQRGYDHPLPLVYLIQWPLYELSGQRSSAGLATTVWWNGAVLAFIAWLTARVRAPWLGVAALVTVPIMAGHVPAGSLILPWNPSLALVPGMALVFVSWRVALGSRRLLPVMVAIAVWCTGAHLGFAPMAITLSSAGVAGLMAQTLRRGGPSALRSLARPATVAVTVGLLMASPLLADLVLNDSSSNPVHIVERGRSDAGVTTVDGAQLVKVLASELAIPPTWASHEPPYDTFLVVRSTRFPVTLAAAAVAALVAQRRRAGPEVVGLLMALAGVMASTAGLANIEAGTLQPWYLLSAHAASMAFVAFVAWSAARSIGWAATARFDGWPAALDLTAPVPTTVARLALPAAALASALLTVPSLHIQPHAPDVDAPTAVLARAVEDRYEPGTSLLVAGPVDFDGYVLQSLVLRLDRAGFDVRVPSDHLYQFTPAMEAPPGWEGTTLEVRFSEGAERPAADGALMVAEAPINHPIITTAETVSLWQVDERG